MKPPTVFLAEMTNREVEEVLKEHDTVIIPTGSTFISATMPYTLSKDLISWPIDVLEMDQIVTLQLSVLADKQLGELVFGGFEGSSLEVDQAIVVGPEEISLPRGYYYPLFRSD